MQCLYIGEVSLGASLGLLGIYVIFVIGVIIGSKFFAKAKPEVEPEPEPEPVKVSLIYISEITGIYKLLRNVEFFEKYINSHKIMNDY